MTARAAAGAESTAQVTALSHEGRGIARLHGKTVFIEDALPGETVRFRILKKRSDFDEAQVTEVVEASPDRVQPRCRHFGTCGGCALQHLAPAAQVAAKQQTLLDNLKRIGGVTPDDVLPPLLGPAWGYRRRARLSAHRNTNSGKVLVGFTERHRHLITDVWQCHTLDPQVGGRIEKISELLSGLSIADKVPQLEVAVGDGDIVLSLRVLAAPSAADRERLAAFEKEEGMRILLQEGKAEHAVPLGGERPELHYRLPASQVDIAFEPADFIQVNGEVNRRLVDLSLELLAPRDDEDVLDLFAGLGNFTLPLARLARSVTGVEGEAGLVARARSNAERNGIANASFEQADLFAEKQHGEWAKRRYARILLDPPRAGAREIIAQFPRFAARKLVYVSCHPATLARDAKTLVEEQGWRLTKAGVLDMFPHTAHVESIAVFERGAA
ncbi:MAG TPA: 23S rRNA (uracil(1939)-C(5))-methyltransferase RlmD [Gammaproteobacteria bacterium]